MKKRKGLQALLLVLSYLVVAVFAAVGALKLSSLRPAKLGELDRILSRKFIGDYDRKAAEDAAAAGMVASLEDRWSYYIPADEYQEFFEIKANSYVGVGITIQMQDDGYVKIIQVEPDGPAREAGILPGDVLIGIDNQDVKGYTTAKMKELVQGRAGTQVTLTVLRDGTETPIPVTRKDIKVQVAQGEMILGNVGLVTIKNFNDNCAEETIAQIEKLLDQGAESLLFDVRNNGGGFLDQMVKILDYLLPEGDLFHSIDYAGKRTVETSDASCLEMPIAVLINEKSFSAAEYFAAVLREYDWAITAGGMTTGKGRFQYTLRLKDGSAVNLSVGEYETPEGVNLAERGGLTPDVFTPVDEDTRAQIYAGLLEPEQDPQIQAAVKALMTP